MGKALYRKYRSKSLDEIVGQPHITTTLHNAVQSGAISHAYLFTGPRGVGKTSIARILAHDVNGLPYDEEANHLDIIEIDAASNRRIDEIRELRDRVHTAPTSAKYKVYIIDEVHMLTKEAFNALLKTLEEPPAHVIFMLATTEAHKLPETIVSRTQRFTFKPVSVEQVVEHLQFIASEEGVDITPDALDLIARHGGGSFRDSISLLDQVRGQSSSVTLSDVQTMLGIAPEQVIDELMAVLANPDVSVLISRLQAARDQGYQAGQLAKQLANQLRSYLLTGTSPIDPVLLTPTLRTLLSVPTANDQEAALELALLDIVLSQSPLEQQSKPQPQPIKKVAAKDISKSVAIAEPQIEESIAEPIVVPEVIADVIVPEPQPESVQTQQQTLDTQTWEKALSAIKQTHNTLYSVARMATPIIDGDELTLVFKFAFHQKRLNETKNKQVIAQIMEGVLGKSITITCTVDTVTAATPKAVVVSPVQGPHTEPNTVSTISNIFGGAEVLES